MPLRLLRFALAHRCPEPRMFGVHEALRPTYDAVIIGAGGHGLAVAYYLARDYSASASRTCVTSSARIWLR